ncbi:hypothetical protein FA95DRAFT_1680376 [Auriscalpium vulgare]|uniref:Uncharacterized protein n=1 Tax=Auriscalpium vulgare TaxID=40419 RepID=A0ACB8RP61_9AGAM|nr:hypothetical protein FA95DRAFT_1680376 [Auriscalpium vulgare]
MSGTPTRRTALQSVATTFKMSACKRYLAKSRRKPQLSSDVLMVSLEALRESAEAFPPLRSAVGCLILLLQLFQGMTSNRDEIVRIAARIDEISALLARAVPDVTRIPPILRHAIETLDRDLNNIYEASSEIARQPKGWRFLKAARHADSLLSFNHRIDEALLGFSVAVELNNAQAISLMDTKVNSVDKSICVLRRLSLSTLRIIIVTHSTALVAIIFA